ncbi:MAG: hypothetical protein WC438_04150 [Candidatus Pacearchaeota archaeon]
MTRNQRRGNKREDKRNNPNKKSLINLGEIVDSAIKEGIETLVEEHPRFANQENFIASYIDPKALKNYVNEEVQNIKEGKYTGGKFKTPEKAKKAIIEKLAGYVSSGEMFNELGKEFILRKSLGEASKRFWTGGWAREILKGEKELDKTFGAFNKLYSLIRSGNYSKNLPQLAKSFEQIEKARFADAAFNVLYEKGVIDKNKYHAVKTAIIAGVNELKEKSYKTLESYIPKLTGTILTLTGFGVLLSTNKMTGAVIGNSTNSSLSAILFGLVTLAAGIVMFIANNKQK